MCVCLAVSLLLCACKNFSAAPNFLTSFCLATLNGKGMFVKWRISVIQHFCMYSLLAIFLFSFGSPIACLQQQKFSYFTCLSRWCWGWRWHFCCMVLLSFLLLLFFGFMFFFFLFAMCCKQCLVNSEKCIPSLSHMKMPWSLFFRYLHYSYAPSYSSEICAHILLYSIFSPGNYFHLFLLLWNTHSFEICCCNGF